MANRLAAEPQREALPKSETVLRVNYKDRQAAEKIAGALIIIMSGLQERSPEGRRIVLCIGSDRSTGDSLGPLVGTYLQQNAPPRTAVWGTLADPVHALNLERYRAELDHYSTQKIPPLVIAVDACLGRPGSVGLIEVGRGPLLPGAGVNKKLPPVGQIYLSGIVNLGGFMEQMVLQSTRLHHVLEISTVIGRSLQLALDS
ncbi:MAG: spore protease YyaC [Firmicutes bacterium]|nr:spore protease YyaC [Bacillota bacterium]